MCVYFFQTEEAGYELDWSPEDRRSLDNFIVGRCIRRSVLDEAFTWLPDPIADALAKVPPRPPSPGLPYAYFCVI